MEKGANKLFSMEDFDFDILDDDEIFIEISAAGKVEPAGISIGLLCTMDSCLKTCWASAILSTGGLVSMSDPTNTYSEYGCC